MLGSAEQKSRAQKIIAMIYQSWQKLSARTSFYLIGGCPQVSKKADLTRFPRRRARKALPPDLFLLFTGWPFIENVELQCVSSAFGLAMLRRGAPTRRASAIFCARDFYSIRFLSSLFAVIQL
ncbi:MAG: hypothetical protein HYZ02_02840 [Candidatus Levybacteria bacterium]|nr:hypothetical protein [Candidatus Levybacteria bacterium]